MGERPTLDPGHPGKWRPTRAPSCRLQKRAKPAHKSARCGVGDGCPYPHSPHPQQVGSRPRPHAPRTGGRACASAQFRTPHHQARGVPPLGALVPPQQHAKPARKCTRCGVGDGSPTPPPRSHTQWVAGLGRTPQGRAVGRGRTPDPARPTRRQEAPTLAPLCRPNSARNQLARARAVGLARGLHDHTPRTHSQQVAGTGCTPQGRTVWRGTAPNPGRWTLRQVAPSPGPLVPPPQRAKPASKGALWG